MITLAKHLLPVHDRLRRGVYAGVGAVEAGDLVMSLGTSGTLFCPSEEPVMDVEGRIAPFCDAAGECTTPNITAWNKVCVVELLHQASTIL